MIDTEVELAALMLSVDVAASLNARGINRHSAVAAEPALRRRMPVFSLPSPAQFRLQWRRLKAVLA